MLKIGLPLKNMYFVVKTNQESAKSTDFPTDIVLAGFRGVLLVGGDSDLVGGRRSFTGSVGPNNKS